MELRYLKTFQKVALFSSFSRAAENINLAQSTVSAHIKALEDELNIPLFDRLGRQIALTGAGELLFHQSKRLLSIEEETLAEITSLSEPKGCLALRVPQTISTYFLPGVLQKFQERFPKVGLEMIGCTFDVERELTAGTIDLAFLLNEPFTNEYLHIEALTTVPLVLVTAPTHPLAHQEAVTIRDIDGQTLLLAKTDCSYRKSFERLLAEEKVQPASTIEFNSIEAIKQSVAVGVGMTLLPEIAVAKELDSKQLTVLHTMGMELVSTLLMIWHKDKWLSPILASFIDNEKDIIGYEG